MRILRNLRINGRLRAKGESITTLGESITTHQGADQGRVRQLERMLDKSLQQKQATLTALAHAEMGKGEKGWSESERTTENEGAEELKPRGATSGTPQTLLVGIHGENTPKSGPFQRRKDYRGLHVQAVAAHTQETKGGEESSGSDTGKLNTTQ